MVCGTTSYCQVWLRNTTRQCAHGADRRHRVGESSRECKKNETRSRSAWLDAPERVAATQCTDRSEGSCMKDATRSMEAYTFNKIT